MVEYSSKIYEGEKDQKVKEEFSMGAPEEKMGPSNGDSAPKLPGESSWKSDSRLREGSQLIQPPDHSYSAEQIRKVKTHILHQNPTPRSILITSALPKEGKSLVAFNLALTFAQEKNLQTILIDADLRNPSLSFELSMERNAIGLADYLASDKWDEGFLNKLTPNFKFMPAGTSSSKAPELNGFSRMKELLGELLKKPEPGKEKEEGKGKRKDNFIFLDGPPILMTSDPIIFSKLVDGIILVVMSDLAPKKAVRKAVDSIDREKIVGVIFNQINLKPSKHYSQFYDRYYRE